ncbi:hypothetical protein Tco_0467167, partial [Tanacetum coccineum]
FRRCFGTKVFRGIGLRMGFMILNLFDKGCLSRSSSSESSSIETVPSDFFSYGL